MLGSAAMLRATWWMVVLAVGLGAPLRQDGYTFRPPEGFRMIRMDLFHGTRVGAVSLERGADRYLSAALTDGSGPDAASLFVSIVGEDFTPNPSTRDEFATATSNHFRDDLGMDFALDRAELVRGPVDRIEVLGTVKQQDQVRTVLVAGMEGEGRHAVITLSAPSGRFDALLPVMREALDSYRPDAPPARELPRSVAGVIAVLLALALFGSFWLWRRRRLRSAETAAPGES